MPVPKYVKLIRENMHRFIGLFDSGMGGLTVLKQIITSLPDENTVYFGDVGRAPYGSRSSEVINRS